MDGRAKPGVQPSKEIYLIITVALAHKIKTTTRISAIYSGLPMVLSL
jgi:hypothetical protein